MIAFIKHIRQCHPPEGPPLVVHCSAGVGRTGTFIVLDAMLQRMEHEKTLDIYNYLLSIRQQRVKMVQNEVNSNHNFNVIIKPSNSHNICSSTDHWLNIFKLETQALL